MKYTVKKVSKNEEISRVEVNGPTLKSIIKVYPSNGWVVVDENGEVKETTNRVTGKKQLEYYPVKYAAQKSADYHNERERIRREQEVFDGWAAREKKNTIGITH